MMSDFRVDRRVQNDLKKSDVLGLKRVGRYLGQNVCKSTDVINGRSFTDFFDDFF